MDKLLKPLMKSLPDSLAFKITQYVAALPQRSKLKDANALNKASRIEYGTNNSKTAWCWGKHGPLVVCVHGWGGGGGGDLAAMAQLLASDGFRVIALDMTAHGSSSGKRLSFRQFARDIAALTRSLKKEVNDVNEEVFAYVGFSAGGLSMMAARKLEGIVAKNYVLIASPTKPYPPLNLIERKLGVSDTVLARYQNFLSRQFGCAWDSITEMAFAYEANKNLMLIYDQGDRLVAHEDGDRIKELWPSAQLVKLEGTSHKNMIYSKDVIESVRVFLRDKKVISNMAAT